MLSDERIREIKERCEKASDNWVVEPGFIGSDRAQFLVIDGGDGIRFHYRWDERDAEENDMQFAAHARQDIPDLLAEIERLKETIRVRNEEDREVRELKEKD